MFPHEAFLFLTLFNQAEKVGVVELHVVLKFLKSLSSTYKIYFVINFNIFRKFLNDENSELYTCSFFVTATVLHLSAIQDSET